MPKVTEAHIEARRQQILDAAARCFSREGFHRTTMQDIQAESGLSAGAIYRYFASKEEIIRAMSEETLERSMELIEQIRRQGETLDVLAGLAETFVRPLEAPDAGDRARCELAIWVEALREPAVGEAARRTQRAFHEAFASIIREGQQRGDINPRLSAEGVGRVMCALYQGLVTQKAIEPEVDIRGYVDAIEALFGGRFWQRAVEAGPESAGPPPREGEEG
jgi:AcrR family transcriptional regulator